MQKSLGEKHMNRGQVNTINGPADHKVEAKKDKSLIIYT